MLAITIKDIKILFNQQAILAPAEKMQRTLRMQFGGYCRQVMRNSIKAASARKQHANAGDPPLYHNGPIRFKDTIFYVDDASSKTVVIGAVLLSATAARGDPVPGALEYGGESRTVASRAFGRRDRRIATGTIAPHPYARPAFDRAVEKKLPDLIKGGIMREV